MFKWIRKLFRKKKQCPMNGCKYCGNHHYCTLDEDCNNQDKFKHR